jgi:hypothetical protein
LKFSNPYEFVWLAFRGPLPKKGTQNFVAALLWSLFNFGTSRCLDSALKRGTKNPFGLFALKALDLPFERLFFEYFNGGFRLKRGVNTRRDIYIGRIL